MKCECDFCLNHEKGDTLYSCYSDDVGITYEYVNNISFCPLCGKELRGKAEEIEENTGWVKCSTRLPNQSGNYLVSGGGKIWICECISYLHLSGWVNNAANPVVQAWMPLPEPYNEVTE